jgi:hypothetical protein
MPDAITSEFQFASDNDGDLHLFPSNINEPNYGDRLRVWVLHADDARTEAPFCSPMMCVTDGIVTNPYGSFGHREVAGWYIDSPNATEIEIVIDSSPAIRVRHPRA